jgi:hypothetical protein
MAKRASTPKFSAEQRRDLRRYGCTDAQIAVLDSRLPGIQLALARSVSLADAKSVAAELVKKLRGVSRILEAVETGTADRVVLSNLRLVAAQADSMAVLDALRNLLPQVQRFAEEAERSIRQSGGQRRGYATPSAVFEEILNALATPIDTESTALAVRAMPARGHRRTKNPFPDIARVCIEAATDRPAPDLRALHDAWRKDPMNGVLVSIARRHGHARSNT